MAQDVVVAPGPAAQRQLIDKLESRRMVLQRNRSTLDSLFDDLAWLTHPAQIGFTTTLSPGTERTDHLFDSTALSDRAELAATVESVLLPKDRQWGGADALDPQLMELDSVRRWFDAANSHVHNAIYNASAQFEQATGELFNDVVTFGSAAMFMNERADNSGMFFKSLYMKNVLFAQNAEGKIDTVFLDMVGLTQGMALNQFGSERVSQETRKAVQSGNMEAPAHITHVVLPQTETTRIAFGIHADVAEPWISIVFDRDAKHVINMSQFVEMPYITPRWLTIPGQAYGFSPGQQALPDIRMANSIKATLIKAGQLRTQPPLMIPNDGFMNPIRLAPGAFIPYDAAFARAFGRMPVQPLDVGGNLPIGFELLKQTQDAINRAYHSDTLSLPDKSRMTATEVMEHRAAFARVMGPALGRLLTEVSRPVYERAFGIELRAGRLPEMPRELDGAQLNYTFFSAVQEAQHMNEVARSMRVFESMMPIAQVKPEVIDNLNLDEMVREIAAVMGPYRFLNSPEEVQAIREQRAEAQAAQAQAERANMDAQTAKTGTEAMQNVVGMRQGA